MSGSDESAGGRRSELLAILRRLAGQALRLPAAALPPERPLTALGLDSLAAVELQQAIETELGVTLPLGELFEDATLGQLADRLLDQAGQAGSRPASRAAAALPGRAAGTPPAGEIPGAAGTAASFPLSPGQRALFYLDRLGGGGPAYVLAGAARLSGALDAAALRGALEALLRRHAALRTLVQTGAGEPSQRVCEVLPAGWFAELQAGTPAELRRRIEEAAFRPFDLERGPLLRAAWIATAPGEAVLVLALHHLAADFWSLAVMLRELAALYAAGGAAAGPLPPVAASYAQHVERQRLMLAGPEGQELWAYWERQLAAPLAALELPTDRPRPRVQSFAGAARQMALAPGPSQRLLALARGQGATLFATLLAAFQALLGRHTGQGEVLIGSPTAGRATADLAGVVGFFVNPVALRGDLRGEPTFAELLARARRTAIDAFSHQQLPFPLLAERLEPARDPGRSPLFQAMLVLQSTRDAVERALAGFALGVPGTRLALAGLELESLGLAPRGAQFDLTLQAAEIDGVLHACLQFNSDLFDAATAARLLGHFLALLAAAAARPAQLAGELPLLAAAERHQALVEAGGPPLAAPAACLHHLCAAQAARTPEAVAVTDAAGSLTHRELWRRARALAARLAALGIGPEQRVGIALERSAEMIVALLATLEAGGAYVPLDLSYPEAHLAYVIADSRMPVVVTRRALAGALPPPGVRRLYLDDAAVAGGGGGPVPAGCGGGPVPAGCGGDPVAAGAGIRQVLPGNLAYVIYTSGSTGRPKGVQVEHGALARFTVAARDTSGIAGSDRVLQFASPSFDVSLEEIFPCLAAGGTLVLRTEAMTASPARFLAACRDW
ncbi:MAG: AMP-binding protein, partial [Acidobacteria bacterium]|nr:AMP-binding protein [Acidobacteriota bacterium]